MILHQNTGNLHRAFENNSALPIRRIREVYLQIHHPISVGEKKVKDIKQECFEAVNSGLPPSQQHVVFKNEPGQ